MMFRFTLSRPSTVINSIPSWDDLGNGSAAWSAGGLNQTVTLGSFQSSNWLADDILRPYRGTYNFRLTASGTINGGAGNTAQITFHFLDADENILESGDAINIPNSAGLVDYAVAVDSGVVTPTYVMIQVNNLTSSSNVVTVAVNYESPDSELEISEPDGWKGAKITWERDPSFFSLIEYYYGSANGAFIFYGENESEGINGGVEFLKAAELAFGFDANVTILIEYSGDDVNYSTVFSGQLDLSQKVEMKDNKMQVPVVRDSFWVKFMNRFDTPIKLSDTKDLDGNNVDPAEPITVNLTCQKIQKKYSGRYRYAYEIGQPEDNGYEYYQPDFEVEELNEIDGKITLPRLMTNDIFPLFEMEEAGEYSFNIKLTLGHNHPIDPNFSQSTLGKYIPYIQFNSDSPIAFTGADVTHGSDVVTEWTYAATVTLAKLDTVKLYVQDQYDSSTDVLYIFGDEGFEFSGAFPYGESFMEVTGQTIYPDTRAQGFLIHDLFHAVAARIGLGTDSVYSEFLGSTLTNARQYDEDGCGWMYAILKGVHIRGYTLTDDDDPEMRYSLQQKEFSISFKDLWDGINPILNLGLGYEEIEGRQVLRIEPKSHFIGDTPPVNFSNVREISSSWDSDYIFKTIKTGFKKWQSENIAAIDDPQTKHTYATTVVKTGKELNIESGFIAASLAIETTRRTKIIQSSDYKFDNDFFIISLNTDDVSPDVYTPELDENFASVSNLLNFETRYNLNLTPMRNLLRWGNYWAGGLQDYLHSKVKFVSGEGNYDMATNAMFETCRQGIIDEDLSEGQDFAMTYLKVPEFTVLQRFGYYFLPILYQITIPMDKEDFDQLDRKQPIGISQTDSNHAIFHIKEMEYEILKSEAVIKAWPEEFFEIAVPEQEINSQSCE